MPTSLYTCDAYHRTPLSVMEEFAREWFDEPRSISWHAPGGEFRLVDGNVTYCVVFVPDHPARYEVRQLDD